MKNKSTKYLILLMPALVVMASSLVSCGDDPRRENAPESITKVVLTFTPTGGGSAIVAQAVDADGEGSAPFVIDDITLAVNQEYTLVIGLFNHLANPVIDIAAEVEAEGHEHMFFFEWSGNVFSSPTGNGNVDNRNDPVNYLDEDVNGFPIGITTQWATVLSPASGAFKILLMHQPGSKSASSTSQNGDDDLNMTFSISVQ